MKNLLRPDDLKKITTDTERAKAAEHLEGARKQEEVQKKLHDAFMNRDIHPNAKDRINEAVRLAAEQGRQEIQVLTFPASYTNDRARRINNNEPDWPDSLEGFAKKAYEYFVQELRPLGYRVGAQVIDYPEGRPGNVAMTLKW